MSGETASCNTAGEPTARPGSTTAGSVSYSTSIASAASRAWIAVSATTIATWSPTCSTLSTQMIGCGGSFMGEPSRLWISQPQGKPPIFESATSRPVKIATTPGIARAAAVSIETMRACACGERRKAA